MHRYWGAMLLIIFDRCYDVTRRSELTLGCGWTIQRTSRWDHSWYGDVLIVVSWVCQFLMLRSQWRLQWRARSVLKSSRVRLLSKSQPCFPCQERKSLIFLNLILQPRMLPKICMCIDISKINLKNRSCRAARKKYCTKISGFANAKCHAKNNLIIILMRLGHHLASDAITLRQHNLQGSTWPKRELLFELKGVF